MLHYIGILSSFLTSLVSRDIMSLKDAAKGKLSAKLKVCKVSMTVCFYLLIYVYFMQKVLLNLFYENFGRCLQLFYWFLKNPWNLSYAIYPSLWLICPLYDREKYILMNEPTLWVVSSWYQWVVILILQIYVYFQALLNKFATHYSEMMRKDVKISPLLNDLKALFSSYQIIHQGAAEHGQQMAALLRSLIPSELVYILLDIALDKVRPNLYECIYVSPHIICDDKQIKNYHILRIPVSLIHLSSILFHINVFMFFVKVFFSVPTWQMGPLYEDPSEKIFCIQKI